MIAGSDLDAYSWRSGGRAHVGEVRGHLCGEVALRAQRRVSASTELRVVARPRPLAQAQHGLVGGHRGLPVSIGQPAVRIGDGEDAGAQRDRGPLKPAGYPSRPSARGGQRIDLRRRSQETNRERGSAGPIRDGVAPGRIPPRSSPAGAADNGRARRPCRCRASSPRSASAPRS